jgi:E3 ubiquitin-protein ligase HERC2
VYGHGADKALRPVAVEGFGGVLVRRVCAGYGADLAIGEDGEVFSWGIGQYGALGHGDTRDQPLPKRVEALRGVRVSSVSVGGEHALALTEDGLVYAWGANGERALLGNPDVERELLPKPVEALRGVRVGSISAGINRGYAVADTGELWAWGYDSGRVGVPPLGHGGQTNGCAVPTPIESMRGIKVDAVAGSEGHTLALADDGGVYAWGRASAVQHGALGLGAPVSCSEDPVLSPRRIRRYG